MENKEEFSYWIIERIWLRVLIGLTIWPLTLMMVLVTLSEPVLLIITSLMFLGATYQCLYTKRIKLIDSANEGVQFKTVMGVLGIPIYSSTENVGAPNRVLLTSFTSTRNNQAGGKAISSFSTKEREHRAYFKYGAKKNSVLIHGSHNYKKIEDLAVEVSRWVDVPINKVERA